MKIVTSSARGWPSETEADAPRGRRRSPRSPLSIGTRPRYSMRRATSAAVGAEIEPRDDFAAWRQRAIAKARHRRHRDRRARAALRRPTSRRRGIWRSHRRSSCVMPPRIAACSIDVRSRSARPISCAPRSVDLQHLEHADAAAIAGAAAALAAAGLVHTSRRPRSRAPRSADRPRCRAAVSRALHLAAVAQDAHQPLRDHGAQRRLAAGSPRRRDRAGAAPPPRRSRCAAWSAPDGR